DDPVEGFSEDLGRAPGQVTPLRLVLRVESVQDTRDHVHQFRVLLPEVLTQPDLARIPFGDVLKGPRDRRGVPRVTVEHSDPQAVAVQMYGGLGPGDHLPWVEAH